MINIVHNRFFPAELVVKQRKNQTNGSTAMKFNPALVAIVMLIVVLLFIVESNDRSTVNSLSSEQRMFLNNYRKSLEDIQVGDFVSMKFHVCDPVTGVDSETFGTYVVIRSPNMEDRRIWLKGPGPGSNQKMEIRKLSPFIVENAIEESSIPPSVTKMADPEWKEMATWFALQ